MEHISHYDVIPSTQTMTDIPSSSYIKFIFNEQQ